MKQSISSDLKKYWKISEIIEYLKNNTFYNHQEIIKIICHLYNLNLNDIYLKNNHLYFFDENIKKNILKKYGQGLPLEYCTNICYFLGLQLSIKKPILIPRPETEELVLKSIDKLLEIGLMPNNILDIGTGSGAIAYYMALNFANSHVTAIDKSKKAITIANINFANLANIESLHLSINKFLKQNTSKKFNFIISNPPYISFKEAFLISSMSIRYESKMALFASKNGTIFYQYLLNNLSKILDKKFLIALEIGFNQKQILVQLIKKNKFFNTYNFEFIKDINSKDRILFIWN